MSLDAALPTILSVAVLALVALLALGRIDLGTAYVLAVVLFAIATLIGALVGADLPWWSKGGGALNRAKSIPCVAAMLYAAVWLCRRVGRCGGG